MAATIDVRAPEVDDARGMAEVHVQAWRVGYDGLLPDAHLAGLDVDRGTERWRTTILDGADGSTALLAEVEGRVAGITQFGAYREVDGQPTPPGLSELWMLNVHPDFWGGGVAQALMAEIVVRLGERPEPSAALWVLDGNVRGRRFYEKEGWSADGGEQRATIGAREVIELRYVRPL